MKDNFDSQFFYKILNGINSNIRIIDVETNKIVYMNECCKKTFQVEHPEGKLCWEVMQKGMKQRCEFCKIEQIRKIGEGKSYFWKGNNTATGRVFLNEDSLERVGDTLYYVQNSIDITDYARLCEEAATDELTGVLNRKAGKEKLDKVLKSMGKDEKFTAVLYDINGLKWVNDTFGHLEGDRLLVYVAGKIEKELSEPDFVFRLSGDEFIIVFMNQSADKADLWMKRILRLLKQDREAAGINYDVTFSYGLATIQAREKLSVSDVLSLADTQMYIQKRDYHILQGQRQLEEQRIRGGVVTPFQYNKEYLFDVLDKSIDDYVFAGNLKTGKFMYSYKMMLDFGLPSQVLENAAAFWGERVHPDDVEMFLRSNQEIADGRTDRHTIVYRAKDSRGKWVHLMCRGWMVRDAGGKSDLFGGIIRNLDKKESDINEELRIISDSSSDGIFKASMTEGFPVLYANEGYYELHGYTKQQMAEELNNHADVLVYEQDRERINKEIEEAIAQQKRQVVLEYRICKRDGSIAWVHVNAGLLPDADGTVMMLGMVMDITERRELEERLMRTQQLFRIASKNTSLNMWEFDFRKKQIIQTEESQKVHGYEMVIENVPETLIETGYIHPDYVETVREFYKQLENENPTTSITLQVKTGQTYWWEKVTYTIVRRKDGKAVWAIGMSEDVTAQKKAEIRVFEEERLRELLSEDMICSFQVNLSQNHLENFWNYVDGRNTIEFEANGYEGVYLWILNTIADEDDKKRFCQQYSPEKINPEVLKERKILNFEFQQKQKNGQILWVLLNVRVIVSPETGELFLFGYLKDIDLIKRRELSLKQKAELDELSSFYNFTTAKLLIEKTLMKAQGETCALVLLDVDNFKKINQSGGFLSGDEVLKAISGELTQNTPFSCIKARTNGDMFLLFCYDLNVQDNIRDSIEKIRQNISRKYSLEEKVFEITVSAGMSLNFRAGMTYEQMYQCASYALQAAKREGKNKLLMYREIGGRETALQILAKQDICETVEGKYVQKQTIDSMAILNLLKESWRRIERGESRDSVIFTFTNYIANILESEHVVRYEREEYAEKFSELETVFPEVFPKNIITIADEKSVGYKHAEAFYGKAVPLPLVLVGIYEKDQLLSVFAMEHVKEKNNYLKMLELISEFMNRTGRFFDLNDKYKYSMQHDQKTGVLNYQSYMKYLEQINADNHSTFGILGIHVVDLKSYNKIYGMKAGDELLKAAADILIEFFGENSSFRVSGAGFYAVCSNITYENFQQRCEIVKERLEEVYTGEFADARVWGDRVISIEKLQQQVEEKLQIARTKLVMMNPEGSSHTSTDIISGLKEAIEKGEFCTFLQPKANVQTGEVCGAEALIRYYDKKKGIIPPARFLPNIEKAGFIRLIDLFVLKDVCRMLKKWIESGWEPFPVSLNYSRATILEPDILEETNQIVEDAGIPKEFIQIEVTETIGSIDTSSLKCIVERFTKAGYKIALDDFGAEYSNIYVLYSLKLSALKLDRRIVSDIYHDKRARVVVESVINICKKLQIECVAEGVETKEQLGVLKEMCCDMIQGYFLNKPLSEEEFEKQYFRKNGRQ